MCKLKLKIHSSWKLPNLHRLKDIALHIIFPNRCMFCRKVLEVNKSLCNECTTCLPKQSYKSQLDRVTIYSPFIYGEGVEVAVQDLKFDGNWTNAAKLGAFMAKVIIEAECKLDIIIPVPLHKKDLRFREFNQTELLAREVSKQIDLPVRKDLLLKLKRTQKQHDLNMKERLTNLQGAFTVPEEKQTIISGMNILVIDDVCTTGSTFLQCAHTLLSAGAVSVTGLSASMVRHKAT